MDLIVNEVNVGGVVKECGISFSEKIFFFEFGYDNCISVKVIGDCSIFIVMVMYIFYFGECIVEINGFNIDFYLMGYLVYI